MAETEGAYFWLQCHYSLSQVFIVREKHDGIRISHSSVSKSEGGAESDMFFLDYRGGVVVRSGPVTVDLRIQLRLSPGDVLHVSKEHLQAIPFGGPIPAFVNQKSKFVLNSTSGTLWLLDMVSTQFFDPFAKLVQ